MKVLENDGCLHGRTKLLQNDINWGKNKGTGTSKYK